MKTAKNFFHIKAKVRSPGAKHSTKSIVAGAAYISGSKLFDKAEKRYRNFSQKKGVQRSLILLPKDAPEWGFDREKLWNAVDEAKERWDERRATEFVLAFPYELSQEQREDIGIKFAEHFVRKYGCAADIAFHSPDNKGDNRNFHAHVFLTHRRLGANGFEEIAGGQETKKTKNGELVTQFRRGICSDPKALYEIRKFFAELQNQAFEAAGLDIVVDHRSYEARGLDIIPTVHEGPAATAAKRQGRKTHATEINEKIKAANTLNQQRTYDAQEFEEEAADLEVSMRRAQAETDRERNDREMEAAIRTMDIGVILDMLAEKQSTFSEKDVSKVLLKHVGDEKKAGMLAKVMFNHPNVIGLREHAQGPVVRYTTRANLEIERKVLAFASNMAKVNMGASWAVSERLAASVLARHQRLQGDQLTAFRGLIGGEGIAVLYGEAGTGKSTTLKAVREAYEGAGKDVLALSHTNPVVQDMKAGGGFKNARTIESAISQVDWLVSRGKPCPWNENTVLVVDEAAMLSTKALRRLVTLAAKCGCKLILVGDDKQLPSIEAGGLFGSIMAVCKTYKLSKVWRIRDDAPHADDQRLAYNLMHKGDFLAALGIFEKIGSLRWSDNQRSAKDDLVRQYLADCRAEKDPEAVRMIFAYTNAEADILNETIRWEKQKAGEMGEDHVLKVRKQADDDPKRMRFAVGDRIQFRENGINQRMKDLGFLTGACADILEIDGDWLTVRLDKTTDGKRDVVKFKVGDDIAAGEYNCFRRGFASTIYSGQGKSIAHSYLLYSPLWRADSAYVALTRHMLTTKLFIPERDEGAWWTYASLVDIPAELLPRAEEMYEAWSKRRAEDGKYVHTFDAYVDFVQERWREQNPRGIARLAATLGKRPETRAASLFHYDEQEMFNEELQKARRASWMSIVANKLKIVRANRYKIDDLPDYELAPAARQQKFSIGEARSVGAHANKPIGKNWMAAAGEYGMPKTWNDAAAAERDREKFFEELYEEPTVMEGSNIPLTDPQDLVRKTDGKHGRRWWLANAPSELTAGQLAQARKDYHRWYEGARIERYKGDKPFGFDDYVKYRMRTKIVPPMNDTSGHFGKRYNKPAAPASKEETRQFDDGTTIPPWMLDEYGWEPDYGEDYGKLKGRKEAVKRNIAQRDQGPRNKGG